MKFAHLADCHLGGWRDLRLRELGHKAFEKAIDRCITEQVDFVIIAGDLFNTAMPDIESLQVCVEQLKRLKDARIAVYGIPGSHDFSPSGKTLLDILESAGLFVNVLKGEDTQEGKIKLHLTKDEKTGALLAGMLGKKGGLEKEYYRLIDPSELKKEGFKIFVFHTAIEELKTKEHESMDALPVSLLPEEFDYYAGGHVHIIDNSHINDKNIIYPGPTFPNNFSELEKLKTGSMVIYDEGKTTIEKIEAKTVTPIAITINDKTPSAATELIISQLPFVADAIVLLRIDGRIKGKVSDVDFNAITRALENKGAYAILRNTSKLLSDEFEEIKVEAQTTEQVEEKLIAENAGKQLAPEKEKAFVANLMRMLDMEKNEGEKVADFDKRITKNVDVLLQEFN